MAPTIALLQAANSKEGRGVMRLVFVFIVLMAITTIIIVGLANIRNKLSEYFTGTKKEGGVTYNKKTGAIENVDLLSAALNPGGTLTGLFNADVTSKQVTIDQEKKEAALSKARTDLQTAYYHKYGPDWPDKVTDSEIKQITDLGGSVYKSSPAAAQAYVGGVYSGPPISGPATYTKTQEYKDAVTIIGHATSREKAALVGK
jgi:hypothetical protein